MNVYFISVDEDKVYKMYKYVIVSEDPKTACMVAATRWLDTYLSDFGADFESVKFESAQDRTTIQFVMNGWLEDSNTYIFTSNAAEYDAAA